MPCDLEWRRFAVNGDDLARPGEAGALDDIDAHSACADHGDGRAFRQLRGIGHCPYTGDHRAADRRQRSKADVTCNRD
jgi:hypothetical protein